MPYLVKKTDRNKRVIDLPIYLSIMRALLLVILYEIHFCYKFRNIYTFSDFYKAYTSGRVWRNIGLFCFLILYLNLFGYKRVHFLLTYYYLLCTKSKKINMKMIRNLTNSLKSNTYQWYTIFSKFPNIPTFLALYWSHCHGWLEHPEH